MMETSTAAAGESVSQELLFGVVLCSVEFAVPQWSLIRHASCSATVCKIAPGLGEMTWLPVFEESLVFLCSEQSFVMLHFSSTQQLEIEDELSRRG